jgi:hypothetical protein
VPGPQCGSEAAEILRHRLEPAASYQVAQALAAAERLPVSQQSLRNSLRERGFLVSIDAGRQMVMVRRTLEGSPRQAWSDEKNSLLT